jgi:hypothetical protein
MLTLTLYGDMEWAFDNGVALTFYTYTLLFSYLFYCLR